jgi:hypothetical protein
LRIEALEVSYPRFFPMKGGSEGNFPRDLLLSKLRLWSGSSISRNNKGGRSMIFAMAVSVGVLTAHMVPHCRPRKMPGVSCRIRQRLTLDLRVRVHRHHSRRLVLVQSSQSQASSLFQFHHLFHRLIPITPSPPRVSVPIHQRAIRGRGRTTISPMGRDSLANPRGTRVRQVRAFHLIAVKQID